LEKWLSLLEGYFFVQNFSNNERITFALLKALPYVGDWWENYCEKHVVDDSTIFGPGPTWEAFVDALKEKYYLVGNYDEQYTTWTTLRYERNQMMFEYTNIFHNLPTKHGIKYFEQHLVLKFFTSLHRYIQTDMEFLDKSSL
jgi:hypothetical protein